MTLLEVSKAKHNHELMVEAYIKQFSGNPITATPEFEEYFREAMSWDALIGPVIDIYEQAYTVDELKAINQFLSSPVGQSFVAKAPEVNEKTSAIFVENMQKAMRHIMPQQKE